MKISVFAGDLCDAPADVLCTSTNPRLSLVMGTGASVRARGGLNVLRACGALIEKQLTFSGQRDLPPGSAHATTAGDLPAKMIIHCVASDPAHRSSVAIIRSCVRNAVAIAEAAGHRTIAIPLFATGHAAFRLVDSVSAVAEELRIARSTLSEVFVVVYDSERAGDVAALLKRLFHDADVPLIHGPSAVEDEPASWFDPWNEHG
jgi:O-acetyl-ADP-ribose deacetylase (regulator of RNase III)